MIDEFANLFGLTVRELRLAGRRIERQSGIILSARMKLRKLARRIRKCRRRILGQKPPPQDPEAGPFCDWQAHKSKRGRLYWQCKYCETKTLHPTTQTQQARAGARCAREGDEAVNGN